MMKYLNSGSLVEVHTLPNAIAPLRREKPGPPNRRRTVPIKSALPHALCMAILWKRSDGEFPEENALHKYFWRLESNQRAQDTELSKPSKLSHDAQTRASGNWVTATDNEPGRPVCHLGA